MTARLGARYPASYRLGFFGSFRHHFVSLRDAHNFFDGCFALGDASPAVVSQSLHAFGDGTLLELTTIALLHDQLPHRLRDETNFINRRTTLIAGLPALITTGATLKASTEFFYRNTDLRKIVARIINHFDTVGTNGPHQSLRDKRLHHRGEKKGFHVHVEQTRDATYGIIRVERAENKVASHGRADCNVRRFNVANLTDHDHIRILSQNVTEAFGESQIDLRFHIDLRDTSNPIFDRLFDGNDAA